MSRPMKFESKEELKEKVDLYFKTNDKPTLSGLAVFLEVDRQTLYNYKKKDEFFDIIKDATAKVEAIYEERAIYGEKPTGVIFALKNMGWSDSIRADSNIKIDDENKIDPSKYTDDELRAIAELQRKGRTS